MNGVLSGYLTCWPPASWPQPPPAMTTGRSTGVCWSPSPMPAPYNEHRVIEQRAVAVRRVAHLFHEPREERHVVRVDLRVLLDVVRVVLVMRDRMVPFGHADGWIGAPARLAGQLHARNTRDVGLIGQHQQSRSAGWTCSSYPSGTPDGCSSDGSGVVCVVLFRPLNAALDFPHRLEVFADRALVADAEAPLEAAHAVGNESRMLRSLRISARRAVTLPPSPNMRSKTTRGSRSCGSGVEAVRHDVEFK